MENSVICVTPTRCMPTMKMILTWKLKLHAIFKLVASGISSVFYTVQNLDPFNFTMTPVRINFNLWQF